MSEQDEFNQRVIEEFRANQGELGGDMAGMSFLLLTTTGAKSGRTITKPLVYTKDGDRLVIVASYAGAPHHPAWYHNVVANPEVTVEVGAERLRMKAEVVAGDERRRLFEEHAREMPIFLEYQKKTSRQLPVLALRTIEGAGERR